MVPRLCSLSPHLKVGPLFSKIAASLLVRVEGVPLLRIFLPCLDLRPVVIATI